MEIKINDKRLKKFQEGGEMAPDAAATQAPTEAAPAPE